MAALKKYDHQNIIFYDGDCGLCNRTVQLVLQKERKRDILFAALQSEFAIAFFKNLDLPSPNLTTFYFWENGKMYDKSTGVLKVTRHLKFPYFILAALRIFPRFLRDYVYDFIAGKRHQIMPPFCVLPTPLQRERFITD